MGIATAVLPETAGTMNIGIPRERSLAERRVALTPAAVDRLVRGGHSVFVEHDAGAAARFTDEEYTGA